MEENKNQTPNIVNQPDGIVVKDYDGRFKILEDGELKELDALLASTESSVKPSEVKTPGVSTELTFPKFTDLAPVSEDSHFKEPEKATEPKAVAELHFHPDDKNDVNRELEKLNSFFKLEPQKKYSAVKITQKLLEKHNFILSEADQLAMLKAVLSYFRQSRSMVQTKDVLTSPKNQGGMGLAPDKVDHMLAIAKVLKQKIEETDGIVVEDGPQDKKEKSGSVQTGASSAISSAAPSAQVIAKEIAPPVIALPMPESLHQAAPQTVVPPEKQKSEEQIIRTRGTRPQVSMRPTISRPYESSNLQKKELETAPKQQPAPPPAPTKPMSMPAVNDMPNVVRPLSGIRTPNIQDVKRPYVRPMEGKLIGRIDELANMDLATWRMLDADPRVRAGKILGKIKNLEHESLTRKSQGIEAWRNNAVYHQYMILGQMSLEHKKDIVGVINDLEARGESTLTREEFEAISDLNRMLRF